VRVLASVDEKTYSPATATRWANTPVVWTNEKMKARNVYIFMAITRSCSDSAFTQIFSQLDWMGAGQ